MNKTKLASSVCVLIAMLLFLGGCKFEDAEAGADAAEDVSDPSAVDSPPGNSGAIGNAPPEIWGTPDTSATVGAAYHFQPEAFDSDGDVLEFSIANKPVWANFESLTGSLQGTPGDVGQEASIVISVADGNSISSMASFAIQVNDIYTPPEADSADIPVSQPPVISGMPNTVAVVDAVYSFLPEASDADGDELSFSIVNKPEWATFDTTTGLLEGTPTDAYVGTSNAIELSATDGTSIAALEKFAITVEQAGPGSFTISWVAPTQNEDGSALTDLAGYRIYFGTSTAKYSQEISLTSPGATTYVIENLAPGKYFLVMTSINGSGLESKYTPELAFDVGG